MTTLTLPPITDAHRRAAFALLAMPGWSYAAALRDPLRAKLKRRRLTPTPTPSTTTNGCLA